MGFLDDIKSKLPFGQNQAAYGQDEYAQEEGYGEYYDEEGSYQDSSYGQGGDYALGDSGQGYQGGYASEEPTNGVLGQTRRGEAESVAVYTRTGQPVGDAERHATTYNPPARSHEGAVRPGAYDTPSSFAANSTRAAAGAAAADAGRSAQIDAHVSAITGATPQLPAYILRPESYDDVETVVRRVRTRQPVALIFVGVRTEVAKRVLDFSYGFACGLGASVREVGDRVFMVLPAGCEIKDSDLAKLRTEGYLKTK